MTAIVLFIANFLLVALLGLQQLNVERRSVFAAVVTSTFINAALLLQFKVLPGPTSLWDAGAFIAGGALGIAASIWMYPVLVRIFERPVTELANSDSNRFDELQDLGQEIAGEVARADVESYCAFDKMGRFTWYDVTATHNPDEQQAVDKAVRYLDLRGELTRHPVQKHLVRFAQ